jgi:hypothetical protein
MDKNDLSELIVSSNDLANASGIMNQLKKNK